MPAGFGNSAIFHHKNTVRVRHRVQPVGNHQRSAALAQMLYRLLYRRLIRLVLPAGEEAAVIFDIETKTRHTLAV